MRANCNGGHLLTPGMLAPHTVHDGRVIEGSGSTCKLDAMGKAHTQQHYGTFAHAVLCNGVVRMDHHPSIPYVIGKGGHA